DEHAGQNRLGVALRQELYHEGHGFAEDIAVDLEPHGRSLVVGRLLHARGVTHCRGSHAIPRATMHQHEALDRLATLEVIGSPFQRVHSLTMLTTVESV